jgi:hypothetical protein
MVMFMLMVMLMVNILLLCSVNSQNENCLLKEYYFKFIFSHQKSFFFSLLNEYKYVCIMC